MSVTDCAFIVVIMVDAEIVALGWACDPIMVSIVDKIRCKIVEKIFSENSLIVGSLKLVVNR